MADPEVIELKLSTIAQLYSALDPAPFRERDLDAGAEEFIVDWARELPRDARLALLLRVPMVEAETQAALAAPKSIRWYFADRAEALERERRELFRLGRRYLAFGLAVLFLSLAGSRLLDSAFAESSLAETVSESLLILGWVANWRPIEVFLYDWQPIERRRRLYRRLAAAVVTLEKSD